MPGSLRSRQADTLCSDASFSPVHICDAVRQDLSASAKCIRCKEQEAKIVRVGGALCAWVALEPGRRSNPMPAMS